MKHYLRNVKIAAVNNGSLDGFNIYLDFSGQHEFLMYHRHNGLLYAMLKDGVRADELRRWSPVVGRGKRSKSATKQMTGVVSHLLDVVDDYISVRETDRVAAIPAYSAMESSEEINAA